MWLGSRVETHCPYTMHHRFFGSIIQVNAQLVSSIVEVRDHYTVYFEVTIEAKKSKTQT
jgi:hypothetical protein